MTRTRRTVTTTATLLFAVLAPSFTRTSSADNADATPPSPKAILAAAFENQYDVDTLSNIELVMRDGSGQERRRRFQAASKVIDGRVHAIGRLTEPEYLRDMTVLTIEANDRGHDAFVYLPSLRRVRRISTAQRGDAFFGTDVTYEDLERRRVEEYEIERLEEDRVGGEDVYAIYGRSLRNFSYSRVVFFVSRTEPVLLEVHYFKRDTEDPFRVITAPRGAMIAAGGHILPTRMTVENLAQGTVTDVFIRDLDVNPPIDERIFTVNALEQKRSIPAPGGR